MKIKKMIDWYTYYQKTVDLLAQDITNQLNILFPKNKYIFQNNHPIRISKPNSMGTPIHQDTQSVNIKKNEIMNYKDGSYKPIITDDDTLYIEVEQNKHIFNFNFVIYEDYPEQAMKICNYEIDKMKYNKPYFFSVKQNFINEAFLFNPHNVLHYRSNQFKGYSIRGDFRIIALDKYQESNLSDVKGPRINLNTCFGTKEDCKDKQSKYHIFMDKIYF